MAEQKQTAKQPKAKDTTPKDEAENAVQEGEATPESEAKAAKSSANATYSAERLIRDGRQALGYPRHVIAGALHGETGELSVADATRRCEEWLKQEVGKE